MNTSKYEYGSLFKDCAVNRELLRLTVFIKNKKLGETFEEKKRFHREFENNKLYLAKQIKTYFEKSIKCRCGKPCSAQSFSDDVKE